MGAASYKAILNEFLLDLTTVSKQRGYEFIPYKISGMGKLQTYILHIPNKAEESTEKTKGKKSLVDAIRGYFLFVHVSTIKTGFWGVSLEWQEAFHNLSLKKENLDWAVILLRAPRSGFLLTSNDFEKMKVGFSISHNKQIKIEEKDLPLKSEFYDWDSFFQLLKL